jgi:hypothetical protein
VTLAELSAPSLLADHASLAETQSAMYCAIIVENEWFQVDEVPPSLTLTLTRSPAWSMQTVDESAIPCKKRSYFYSPNLRPSPPLSGVFSLVACQACRSAQEV